MPSTFFAQLEELFELAPGTLTGAEQLTQLPGWSSLLFVSLIAMVDEEYGVTLAPKEVLACRNVAALGGLVQMQAAA